MISSTLSAAAVEILTMAEPAEKARLSAAAAAAWRGGGLDLGATTPPDRPARPARPALVAPGQVPRRRLNSAPAGRIALLHALAHIELNAIDLAWDVLARFATPELPRRFAGDWVRVAEEEARHYTLLAARLADLGASYGELDAHDGLWESAAATAHDLVARLAVVPLVLEARGLDVTPAMIERLRGVGDVASADVLEVIYRDEIGHVAIGRRWFHFACAARGLDPAAAWPDLVRRHFKGRLKPPFNREARDAAGLPASYYEPLTA